MAFLRGIFAAAAAIAIILASGVSAADEIDASPLDTTPSAADSQKTVSLGGEADTTASGAGATRALSAGDATSALSAGGATRALSAGDATSDSTVTESTTQKIAAVDTTKPALLARKAADNVNKAEQGGFSPEWSASMKSKETDVSIGSKMQSNMSVGEWWKISNSITVNRKSMRGRDIKEGSESFDNVFMRVIPGLYDLNIRAGDSYTKKTTLGMARFGKNIVFENQGGSVGFVYKKPLFKASSSQFGFNADLSQGTHDFKFDRSVGGGIGGAVAYNVGDMVNIRAGVGHSYRKESSRVGSYKFAGLPSYADTLKLGGVIGKGESKLLDVNYTKSVGVERKITPPRGNSLEILDQPENAKREEAHKRVESLEMRSSLDPLPFLSLKFDFKHDSNSQKYRVDTRLTKEVSDNSINVEADYKYSSKGHLVISISNENTDNDFGPVSISSYKEKDKAVTFRLSHSITDSTNVRMSGSTSLKQRFFKKYESNPRDADHLYYSFDMTFHSSPFKNVDADINVTTNRQSTINIDRTLSGDNRIDYLYRVIPKIKLRPASWVTINQEYTIKIEYTDFVFKADKNYLNRTTSLNTNAKFVLLKHTRFSFGHSYLMKDTGSYLPHNGERLYNRSSEIRQHGIDMRVEYRPAPDFAVKAESNFNLQRNTRFGVVQGKKTAVNVTDFNSGGMKVGFERKKKIGSSGAINLDISYVKNFGAFISKERREYWLVDANISFKF